MCRNDEAFSVLEIVVERGLGDSDKFRHSSEPDGWFTALIQKGNGRIQDLEVHIGQFFGHLEILLSEVEEASGT